MRLASGADPGVDILGEVQPAGLQLPVGSRTPWAREDTDGVIELEHGDVIQARAREHWR